MEHNLSSEEERALETVGSMPDGITRDYYPHLLDETIDALYRRGFILRVDSAETCGHSRVQRLVLNQDGLAWLHARYRRRMLALETNARVGYAPMNEADTRAMVQAGWFASRDGRLCITPRGLKTLERWTRDPHAAFRRSMDE